jgi:hypothetical protein
MNFSIHTIKSETDINCSQIILITEKGIAIEQSLFFIEPYKLQKFTKGEITQLICSYMPYVVSKKTINIEPYKPQKFTKGEIAQLICSYMP